MASPRRHPVRSGLTPIESFGTLRPGYGLSNGRLHKIENTKDSARHPRNRLDPVEGLAMLFGKIRQAAKLGECVGEVVAVGVDDGDLHRVGGVEEKEVRAHASPFTAIILVGYG